MMIHSMDEGDLDTFKIILDTLKETPLSPEACVALCHLKLLKPAHVYSVLEILRDTKSKQPEVQLALVEQLANENSDIRKVASQALEGSLSDKAGLLSVAALLKHPNSEVRATASYLLSRTEVTDSDFLISLIQGFRYLEVYQVMTLCPLLRKAKSPDPQVQLALVHALAENKV